MQEALGEKVDDSVPEKFLERHIVPALRVDGFVTCTYRNLRRFLEYSLDVPEGPQEHGGVGRPGRKYGFVHFLNLLWYPIIQHIESICKDESIVEPEGLDKHKEAILAEMSGVVSSASEVMSFDDWVQLIQDTLRRLVQVEVPIRLIAKVTSSIVPLSLDATPANAMHILRSSLCSKLVGPTLALQASRLILAEVAEVPVKILSEQEVSLRLKADLVSTLERMYAPPEPEESAVESPLKKYKKDYKSIAEMMTQKSQEVMFLIKNRLSSTRFVNTMVDAATLIKDISGTSGQESDLQSMLHSRFTLHRHLLLLDAALDRCTSDRVMNLREQERFAGCALSTDESPPGQPRFRGLRFQITVMYWGTFPAVCEWESFSGPPIIVHTILGDIMHCPGKKGLHVSRVVEKQLARVGLNCFDVVSGTGDGGGENEGSSGVHAYFENLNPSYVRRRCLPHISWRTADMAIRSSGLDYKALAAYFVEGSTWSRLREIAIRDPRDGGLGIFKDGSRACKEVFGNSPSAIIQNRPETDLNFLKFLQGKEHILHRLATKDLEQRALSADTRAAVASLGNIDLRIRRRVLLEILERCMYLYFWNGKHKVVASSTSWDALVQKAVSLILDLECTPRTLEKFNMTVETFQAMDEQPKTWVELAVLEVVGEQDLVADKLKEALDAHRLVSDQAAAHLNLLLENTFRTPWLAAKLLSQDATLARDSAASLVRHLVTTRPGNRTSFEKHLLNTEALWQSLEDFSNAEPPVQVWKADGKYEVLFTFLAPRFLLAPDDVLDAERVHARWQWICSQHRGQTLPSMNGSLRLMHYIENNQGFPSHEDLLPHLEAERKQHQLAQEALEDDVALGWRS